MEHSTFNGKSTCDDVLRGLDLAGRTALVTGANAGIGFETARSLAHAGAHVIVACRSPARAAETVERIRTLHDRAQLTPVALDLASFASIQRAAAAVTVPRLDVLICNAGLFLPSYRATADGIEETVGVCHFGHALLVNLLFDRLRAAAPARVVMVASVSHRSPAELNFDRFPLDAAHYGRLTAYGQAKLCNVLYANELTRRHGADGVFANSLHPGTLIGTQIFRNSIAARLLGAVAKPFTKSLAQGAATSVYCATAPALERVGGRYYNNCAEEKASRGARDEDAAARLWDLTQTRIAGASTV